MAQETTIPDYIDNYRDMESSFDTIHFKSRNDLTTEGDHSLILLSDGILEKYRSDLKEIVVTKRLTSKEQTRYFCNPWVLSYDLYGSVEYWGLLIDLNNMTSVSEFTIPNIKVYDSTLPEHIDAILALEEESIDLNNESLEDEGYDIRDYESDSDDDIEDPPDEPEMEDD